MGAASFHQTIDLEKLDRDAITSAFNRLSEDSVYEDGHSYNGGIGHKSGWTWSTHDILDADAVHTHIEEALDGKFRDKWRYDAGAVASHAVEEVGRRTETVRATVDLAGLAADDTYGRDRRIRKALVAAADKTARKNETAQPDGYFDPTVVKRTIRRDGGRTDGKAVTVWTVTVVGELPRKRDERFARVDPPQAEHDTQADARAAAEQWLDDHPTADVEIVIGAHQRRDTGKTAMVRLTNRTTSLTVEAPFSFVEHRRNGKYVVHLFGMSPE